MIDRVLCVVGVAGLVLSLIVTIYTNDRIDPPRCAKVKCTFTRDTVWVMGKPMPEKDLDCKCLAEEKK